MTSAAANQDKTWSGNGIKNVEGDDGLRTLECLRGRLLAERQASKSAKEDAELMSNKLIELEKKLQEEAKLRKKADKKFNFLLKKLESLKISHNFDGLLEQWSSPSSSDQSCGISCISSTSSSSSKKSKNLEDSDEPKSQITLSPASSVENQSSTFHSQQSSRAQDSSDSNSCHSLKDSPLSKSSCEFTPSRQDSNTEDSWVEMETRSRDNDGYDDEGEVDDTLALVPVYLPAESTKKSELKMINKNVSEVLDALRLAREEIQSKMERRRGMIRVGPS